MSLLREIQDAAIAHDVPLAVVLRKALVLAARLDHAPLREWVEYELNGYPDTESLPAYRQSGPVEAFGSYVGPGYAQARNMPIPPAAIPERHRKYLFEQHFMKGVAEYEDLVRSEGELIVNWPADAIAALGGNVAPPMRLISAHMVIARATVTGLLDAVRNRVVEQTSPGNSLLGAPMRTTASPDKVIARADHGGLPLLVQRDLALAPETAIASASIADSGADWWRGVGPSPG